MVSPVADFVVDMGSDGRILSQGSLSSALSKDAKLLDVIRAVRADEATHRFVNHSLANLNQARDVNPFAIREPDMKLKGTKIA